MVTIDKHCPNCHQECVKFLKRVKQTCILLCVCLCLPIFSGCLRMEYINAETAPKERLFFGVREWNKGYYYDQFTLVPPVIIAASWALDLPFDLIGDLVCLPYDLYVNAYCACNPNLNYCIRFHENDKMLKLLASGVKVTDGGRGPYHSSLTPEQTALKYDNIEALSALWTHGLKMSGRGMACVNRTLALDINSSLDKYIKYYDFCNTAINKIAEDKAWDYLLNEPKYRKFLFDFIAFNIEFLYEFNCYENRLKRNKNNPEAYRNGVINKVIEDVVLLRKHEIEKNVIGKMELLLEHGLDPNIPDIKYLCYLHGLRIERRVTLLDFIQHTNVISDEMRQQLLALLKKYGAITYAQLVLQNPNLPHLHTEGITINSVYQPVIDILQNSTMAEYYRLSNTYPNAKGDILVVETAAIHRWTGKIMPTLKVPAMERKNPDHKVELDMPFGRMIFWPIDTKEEYDYRQRKDVYKPSTTSTPPDWITESEYILSKKDIADEGFQNFPKFNLYYQIPRPGNQLFGDIKSIQPFWDDLEMMKAVFTHP